MNRSLVPLLLSLVGVTLCATACFVMLAPYQIYRAARLRLARARLPVSAVPPAEHTALPRYS